MFAPIFEVCAANAGVTALIGTSPTRLYPFGEAPATVVKPYAVWQTIGGLPENYLSNRPDIDLFSIQIDVYADTAVSARAVAKAIRDAIEDQAYVTRWSGESTEPDTKLKRFSFDVDWHVHR